MSRNCSMLGRLGMLRIVDDSLEMPPSVLPRVSMLVIESLPRELCGLVRSETVVLIGRRVVELKA
ncbi:hypothetical protein ANO11243_019930 [Dothideomycetidae sp. 11243]|nr:hypothetical protein ANO11243_019930 [fungal sp. No.11243]